MIDKTQKLKDIINKSGYPLQLALEYQINLETPKHKFRVLSSEHRWLDKQTNNEGYIDLILEHQSISIRMVIECKRITGNWNFLIPHEKPNKTNNFKGFFIPINTPDNLNEMKWVPHYMYPESYVSSFCVLETNNQKDDRSLEKISGDLLESLESIAKEEIPYKCKPVFATELLYLPVIVTTANIQLCFFNPEDISLDDGKITASEIIEQDYVRFEKSLSSNIVDPNPIEDIRKADKSNSRTVVIVQANKINNFLGEFGLF
jgi:hypothetical protein